MLFRSWLGTAAANKRTGIPHSTSDTRGFVRISISHEVSKIRNVPCIQTQILRNTDILASSGNTFPERVINRDSRNTSRGKQKRLTWHRKSTPIFLLVFCDAVCWGSLLRSCHSLQLQETFKGRNIESTFPDKKMYNNSFSVEGRGDVPCVSLIGWLFDQSRWKKKNVCVLIVILYN